jgi:hypothetical protein
MTSDGSDQVTKGFRCACQFVRLLIVDMPLCPGAYVTGIRAVTVRSVGFIFILMKPKFLQF